MAECSSRGLVVSSRRDFANDSQLGLDVLCEFAIRKRSAPPRQEVAGQAAGAVPRADEVVGGTAPAVSVPRHGRQLLWQRPHDNTDVAASVCFTYLGVRGR